MDVVVLIRFLIPLFLTATKLSVDALKRRLHVVSSKYQAAVQPIKTSNQAPLFKAAIQLAIPNVVMRPSLDEIQVVMFI